jgi:hypothetical protein
MADRLDLVLCTVNNLNSVAITLTEYARELPADPEARLTDFEEVPELLAESLVTAIESLPDDRLTEDRNQLLGALRRYLDGWTE